MGVLPKIARAAPHFWEEPCISGTKGSGTIFFSGCVLSCVFCQNNKISAGGYGKTVSVYELIGYIKSLEEQGVHNINLVSPTPYIESIISVFEKYRPSVPVVYNTGGYEKAETIKRLEGIVDIYLPDMKYIKTELSGKYSGAVNYFEYALPAIKEMVRQTGKPVFDESQIKVAAVPGTAIGLAWTSMGGDTLLIESTSFAGKSGLVL
ncbi:MAG: radical SAM protein, partial [Clostridia bacterium]|nr:radical SAM protein [Clostridia bacterium]